VFEFGPAIHVKPRTEKKERKMPAAAAAENAFSPETALSVYSPRFYTHTI
jgi:hypothetical protein